MPASGYGFPAALAVHGYTKAVNAIASLLLEVSDGAVARFPVSSVVRMYSFTGCIALFLQSQY
jgi:hypothetical protein